MNALTKLILTIVLGGVVVVGVVGYLIKPSLRQVTKLNEDLKVKKIETKTLEQQILAYKTAQSDLAKATEKERIEGIFVERETLDGAIKVFEAAAFNTGTEHVLTINEEEADAPKPVGNQKGGPVELITAKRGLDEVSYSLYVKNDFEGIMNFIKYLENSPHFTEISKVTMQTEILNGSDNQIAEPVYTGQINATINGVFFVNSNETTTK